ncbi:glycoside hydrolase family 9 protein [Natrarchaeobius oligotrophus]|uniref:Glycoside hydrolase n=1 Tax=Natrarchaeobius chitinivorans TaxID=1679083 RepID=A0A3N6M6H8_NATCH|nr:glycoside hydrolase family 9 protein [Natrarchaeobius chitinivorans]RQG99193.1 glycoside hydrolase [Natrarchaeobius chitinivorans]
MDVLVNQAGYDRDERKRAILACAAGETPGRVRVVDADTDAVVVETDATRDGPVANWRDWVFWSTEFTALEAAGSYYVAVDVLEDAAVDGDGSERETEAVGDENGFAVETGSDGSERAVDANADGARRRVRSHVFDVDDDVIAEEVLSDVLYYFKTQRASGRFDRADRSVPFVGDRDDAVDVSGGWYDASGDMSKYLSHLSYANYVNPQQAPIVVWGLLDAFEQLYAGERSLGALLEERLLEESLHGADFLVRMCDDEGYFYHTVFDQWSKETDRREICAYEGEDGTKTADYQAGYRQGGGVSIAALARASRVDESSEIAKAAAFDPDTYRSRAIDAFDHLEERNEAYLDDGTENVIDDYCALLAATELYGATGKRRFYDAASDRARALLERQTADGRYAGWWCADDGDRPFFHAAEEGLPALALCRFLEVAAGAESVAVGVAPTAETAFRDEIVDALASYWTFELEITTDVVNPFGYARAYVKAVDEPEPRAAFFFPHQNETGYWWQGENARIASLAAAAVRSSRVLENASDGAFGGRRDSLEGARDGSLENESDDLGRFAQAQLDWILGLNPFDTSMVEGTGRNPPHYHERFRNVPGGICNGITAGVTDESDVAFLPEGIGDDHAHRWRWAEQWLPHAAWFVVAVASRHAME